MPSRDVVVGGSAGALEGLSAIIGGLPASIPACVLVVVHSAPHGGSLLPDILQRVSKLTVAAARDGDAVRPGRVYLAPPDHHLLIESGKLLLGRARARTASGRRSIRCSAQPRASSDLV
jgi:two-component system chemotaxis response regulator CheB